MADVPQVSVSDAANKIANAIRDSAVTTLTAAIIQRASRSMTLKEIFELRHDVSMAMYPNPQSGSYIEWAKTKDEKFAIAR